MKKRVSYEEFIEIMKGFMGEYLDTLPTDDSGGYDYSTWESAKVELDSMLRWALKNTDEYKRLSNEIESCNNRLQELQFQIKNFHMNEVIDG
jgi:hypothetical protein